MRELYLPDTKKLDRILLLPVNFASKQAFSVTSLKKKTQRFYSIMNSFEGDWMFSPRDDDHSYCRGYLIEKRHTLNALPSVLRCGLNQSFH